MPRPKLNAHPPFDDLRLSAHYRKGNPDLPLAESLPSSPTALLPLVSMNDLVELRRWYDQYIATNAGDLTPKAPLILAVQDDELDVVLLEKRINDLTSQTSVADRFCHDCRTLFNDWPDLSDNTTTYPDGTQCFPGSGADWMHVFARTSKILRLRAAARNGCLLCALIV